MTRFFTTSLFLFISITGRAQPDTAFRLVKTMVVTAADLAVDHLENLYVLTPGDQLKKFNAQGDSVAVYNDVRRFGKLHAFDVSNPLKTLLFYKDFSTLVLLDRQLSVRTILDLRRQNIIQLSAAALSYDNHIWLFDALENKLKKVSDNGTTLFETADFRTIFSESFVPEKIIDHNNSLYLFAADGLVMQFDYFGTFQKKYYLPHWTNLALVNRNIIGTTSGGVALFNTASGLMQQQYQFPSSFGSFNQYLIGNTKIFARAKDSVNIYAFKFY